MDPSQRRHGSRVLADVGRLGNHNRKIIPSHHRVNRLKCQRNRSGAKARIQRSVVAKFGVEQLDAGTPAASKRSGRANGLARTVAWKRVERNGDPGQSLGLGFEIRHPAKSTWDQLRQSHGAVTAGQSQFHRASLTIQHELKRGVGRQIQEVEAVVSDNSRSRHPARSAHPPGAGHPHGRQPARERPPMIVSLRHDHSAKSLALKEREIRGLRRHPDQQGSAHH